jgi:DNA mismatch endonuclease, patch repair protein
MKRLESPRDAAIERRIGKHLLVFDAATSARMGGIRQRDTSAERLVRRVLHAMGLRYRTTNRDLPGSPDVANRSQRWAVFVHGCYWHRHAACARTTTPKRNRAFWVDKFRANQARDRRAERELRRLGYAVVVVWECEAEESYRLADRLAKALGRLTSPSRTATPTTRPASCRSTPAGRGPSSPSARRGR